MIKRGFSILLSLSCGWALAQPSWTLPSQGGRPLMPDEWLFGQGQPYHFRKPASPNGLPLERRAPTPSEKAAIEKIQARFAGLPSKAFLLGDKRDIVWVEYKAPAHDESTFLSASIDKTVTAMSAGVALCEGKIALSTKAKDLLPELAQVDIGESTLRHNLMMASGTTRALDDSQSMTPEELSSLVAGRINFMDLIQGRLGKRNGWSELPGERFSYKTQDPTLVGMMISAAYGMGGKHFRDWQDTHFFPKVRVGDRRIQGRDTVGYAWSEGNTRMTLRDWARFAIFVQEARQQNDCFGQYVRDATRTQIKSDQRFAKPYAGYGYLTWTDNADIPNSYSALGYGGQAIVWSTTSDKYFIVFSNNVSVSEIHSMAKLWLP
jgi:CubicO group peptidase (beta-lactamase class C family)